MYCSTQYASPLGLLTLCCHGEALVGLWLEGQRYFGGSVPEPMVPDDRPPVLAQTKTWLDRYFANERPDPSELPLAPAGSPFRQAVWELLCTIPYGQTVTYGDLTGQLGRPSTSSRAVGGAVSHNPISIIIPCHRVVGHGGQLTGYAGGLDKKLLLLKHEGADLTRFAGASEAL